VTVAGRERRPWGSWAAREGAGKELVEALWGVRG